jgi:HlyD family secretion protein
MTANVKIMVDHLDEVLKIPNAALRFRPKSDAPPAPAAQGSRSRKAAGAAQVVWVLNSENTPQPVTVQLGISDGTWTEVKSGDLHDGQPVITAAISKDDASAGAAASPFGGGAQRRRGPGF